MQPVSRGSGPKSEQRVLAGFTTRCRTRTNKHSRMRDFSTRALPAIPPTPTAIKPCSRVRGEFVICFLIGLGLIIGSLSLVLLWFYLLGTLILVVCDTCMDYEDVSGNILAGLAGTMGLVGIGLVGYLAYILGCAIR